MYHNPKKTNRLDIAVVGTGVAGLSAAWLLQAHHNVTVYEKNPRLGGHANTVEVVTAEGRVPIDTGFIVYNERNYPNLTALFAHLEVPTAESDMSFGASLDGGGFEYAGNNLNSLLGQRSNLVKPRFWRMVAELARFWREAPDFLADPAAADISLGEYLRRASHGEDFARDHLLPMGAAIWSTTAEEIRSYPAAAFIRFFESHGLLNLADRPRWRTVCGGSQEYVRRISAPFRDRVRFGGVRGIERGDAGVRVVDAEGRIHTHDHVVLACHCDEALALLRDADGPERELLGSWRYTSNRAVLHDDPSLMPRRRRVWSSWNFIDDGQGATDTALTVTYWMNRLQALETARQFFVTLNPSAEPPPEHIFATFDYTHPYFDAAALRSQRRLWSLQGRRRTWFCGSYFGFGFHEDALQSGLAVAEELGGGVRPWSVAGDNDRLWRDHDRVETA